ncbi:hypothetical protein GX831_03690 [bacterium]|jgi:thiamine transporter|nr:hypothetical protein [bacterium]
MNIRIRQMTETAILIALAVLLDLLFKAIPILKMPTGGSFSLTMLPLIINGYRNGLKWGIISGLAYAVINFALDGYYWHWGSIVFDYLLAFGLLGLTGLFKNLGRRKPIYIFGIIFVCFLRYLCHSLSGVIFFSSYAEDWFTENPTSFAYGSVFLYSFVIYNGPYMLANTIGCLIASLALYRFIYPVKKVYNGNK